MSPTCPPWCGCHGNGRCLPTAHWTFCSYGRLHGGRMREPISMKFGTQQHVRAAMTVTWPNIKIFKIQRGGRPPCWKILAYHNSLSNGPIGTNLGWSHPITFPTCPPKWGCHGNGRCLATALWTFSSYGRLEVERVNQLWWNLVCNSKFGQHWQSCDQILKVGRRSMLESIRNAITRLQMDRLGRNFGGRIPSCSNIENAIYNFFINYNSCYDGTDWDDSWVVASKQHLCSKTVSLVFGRYC